MKKSLLPVLLASLLASRAPAVELEIATDTITPTTTIELRFDETMVDKSRVGAVEKAPPLTCRPPVEGEFKWTSTRGGQFRFTKAPPMGVPLVFSTAEGLKDVTGKALAVEEFDALQTEGFKVTQIGRLTRYARGPDQRRPVMLVQFNDSVNLTDVSKRIFLFTASGHDFAPVKVRMAKAGDFDRFRMNRGWGYLRPGLTWEESFTGKDLSGMKPDESRPNAVIVEAVDPLPPGENWSLKVAGDVKNASGTTALGKDHTEEWGTVQKFEVRPLKAVTHFDEQHEVVLHFNKSAQMPEKAEDAAALLAQFVKVEPQPANYSIVATSYQISLKGDFELEKEYRVAIAAGVPSEDGMKLENPHEEKLVFHPSEAFVSTPAFQNSQLAAGNGVFDIYAANFKELRIRVKQLNEGELVKARGLYPDSYENRRWDKAKSRGYPVKEVPFEKFPGKVVFDKVVANTKALEKATLINLNWREILGRTPAAPVFIEIEAPPQDGAPRGTALNRAIVEFTDIGVIVKDGGPDMLLYAFSLKTGKPLAGVEFTLMDQDRGFLHAVRSDALGVATTSGRDVHWILARRGADGTALHYGTEEGGVRLWRQGINYAWDSPWKRRMQTFLFSDRPVYRPGETAHVKAIARYRIGDELSLGMSPIKARLLITDPRGRETLKKDIEFSANGTWSGDVPFPETVAGWYGLRMEFEKPRPGGADEADDAEEDSRGNRGNVAVMSLRVDDFKPNTFEVAVEGAKYKMQKDRISVPLHANYYMGKSLSSAKAVWNASIEQNYVPPQEFADFSFGDAPTWWHYGEDRDEDAANDEAGRKEWGAHGELTLADDGTATIDLPPPPAHKAALPQTISIFADVTDVNQQTISASTQFQIPGADFLVGVRKNRWYGSAGQAMDFEFTSITPEGKPFGTTMPVDIKIERQEWNTVRVEGAGGEVTTKNQMKLIEELKATVQVEGSKTGAKTTTAWAFTPKKGGTYFLTATAKDGKGTELFTQLPFYILGGDGYPWAVDAGDAITLQPEKTRVKPGDELSIVVKTPISGTALVTVERNRIHRRYLAPISPENPVVKVTFTEEDAPNAYVSVVVIRGADGSKQPHSMPEYKVGYCEINVESLSRKLFVEATATSGQVLPGGDQTVSAIVKDDKGVPVAGSEVALYAVDEGVLSLMSYQTPQPLEFFHKPMPLAVTTATSISRLLSEDVDNRERGNKGIIVGGGGDEAEMPMRKNFVATAIWSATLITDAEGRASAAFKAPDSLTRYRIMAVAVKGADRFGSGESAFIVNKPLMLDPVVPRFAHVGDEILVKAVLHNTTTHSGDVELELKLDDTATFISEQRPYAMVAMKNRMLTNDGRMDRRTVSLKAGETAAFAFPVKFVKNGSCAWQWRAHTTRWSDAKPLGDAVESRFEVTHPAPALREVRYFELTSARADDDLLKKINPQLLESDGELRLNFNKSRLGEARDALEHLLHYPYGCVEQTTSSTLPWLALSKYEALFPDLLEAGKVRAAIQKGADRILSMQTDEGGLAYWPGGKEPLLWASAYGGFGLLKAKDYGITVPDDVIERLTAWISKELRNLDLTATRESWHVYDAPLALYVLAKAGKPEAAYQNVLYQRRDKLPEMSRLFLALAMCLTNEKESRIAELIAPPKVAEHWDRYWLGENTAAGLRMIACAHLGRKEEANKYADEILNRRSYYGHWGTTFSNAWILLGLSATEGKVNDASPVQFQLAFGDRKSDVTLKGGLSSASVFYQFDHKAGAQPLRAALPAGQTVRGRLELKAWPDLKTFQPVQKGFGITRHYERLTPAGALEPAKNLRVGDLIVVTLDINVIRGNRYLALEDPLPSVFEPVNPEFATQNQRNDAKAQDRSWFCDHRELRSDKALFFTSDWSRTGNFELKYLARVIAEGDVIAPPTRIEAMYEPDHYGLGNIEHIQTLPMLNGENVAGK